MRILSTVLLGLMGLASQVQAHSFTSMTQVGKENSMQTGLAFLTSKTEYELENGEKFSLDRKMFGVDFTTNVGDDIAIFGQGGMIMRTELDDEKDFKGDGYLLGMGVKSEVYRSAKVSTVPFLQFNYLTEELKMEEGDVDLKTEIDIYEVSIGALVSITPERRFSPFVGIEIFPINDGEAKSKAKSEAAEQAAAAAAAPEGQEGKASLSKNTDFERDDILCLRVGGVSKFDKFSVRGEAALIAETTFTLAAGFEF